MEDLIKRLDDIIYDFSMNKIEEQLQTYSEISQIMMKFASDNVANIQNAFGVDCKQWINDYVEATNAGDIVGITDGLYIFRDILKKMVIMGA